MEEQQKLDASVKSKIFPPIEDDDDVVIVLEEENPENPVIRSFPCPEEKTKKN